MKLALAALLVLCASEVQDPAKQRLRDALKDTAPAGTWIYDDVDAGYAEASRTGKPLMVVIRCVP
jgi:serine protease Do